MKLPITLLSAEMVNNQCRLVSYITTTTIFISFFFSDYGFVALETIICMFKISWGCELVMDDWLINWFHVNC